jgi:hypothetical protein
MLSRAQKSDTKHTYQILQKTKTLTLLTYVEMKECNIINCGMMWANLEYSNLIDCKMFKTILVSATML